jgi:hypothetical protein
MSDDLIVIGGGGAGTAGCGHDRQALKSPT